MLPDPEKYYWLAFSTWTSFERWYFITQVLSAIGSFVVAILALFGEGMRNWLRRPELEIEVSSKPPLAQIFEQVIEPTSIKFTTNSTPYEVDVPRSSFQIRKTLKIRMKISNTGKGVAINPNVIGSMIYKKRDADTSFYQFKTLVHVPFVWDVISTESATRQISPNFPGYLTIAEVITTESSSSENGDRAVPQSALQILIGDGSDANRVTMIGKGTVVMPIILVADNVRKKIEKFIQIHWNGDDFERLESNLSVAEISKSDFQGMTKG